MDNNREHYLAYQEYVAWARIFAVREAKMLLQHDASISCIEDVLKHVSDLSALVSKKQGAAVESAITRLLDRATELLALRNVGGRSPTRSS